MDRIAACIVLMCCFSLLVEAAYSQPAAVQPTASGTPATQPQRRRTPRVPAVIHVAPGGDDANTGSADAPVRTIQRGCDLARSTDTVWIAAGVYREKVKLTQSGRYFPNRQLNIIGENDAVVLDAEGLDLPDKGAAIFDTNAADHLYIRGISVRNGGFCGLRVYGSWQVVLENCKAENIDGSGIMVDKSGMVKVFGCEVSGACKGGEESISVKRSQDVEVGWTWSHHTGHEGIDVKEGSKHVRVHHSRFNHTQAQGMYAEAWDSPTHDIVFDNNLVHDCLFGAAAGAESGGTLSDVWFVNNVIRDCAGPGFTLADWGSSGMSHALRDIRFVHNTVAFNRGGGETGGWGGGVWFENSDTDGILIANNLLYHNGGGQFRVQNGKAAAGLVAFGNLAEGDVGMRHEGLLESPIGFRDPDNRDFRLRADSPAVDAASEVPGFPTATDHAGKPRVAGAAADIGALELHD